VDYCTAKASLTSRELGVSHEQAYWCGHEPSFQLSVQLSDRSFGSRLESRRPIDSALY
jgi:hypothetical protein